MWGTPVAPRPESEALAQTVPIADVHKGFPDRAMIGTDPCCGLMGRYNEIVQVMRSHALAAMKPETLEKVAYQNALRVFGLPN
jgi:predicted TIM-barrel fold metal-dependent hydrolase